MAYQMRKRRKNRDLDAPPPVDLLKASQQSPITLADLIKGKGYRGGRRADLKTYREVEQAVDAGYQVVQAKAQVTALAYDIQKAVDRAAQRRGMASDPKSHQQRVITEGILFDRSLHLHIHGLLQDRRAQYYLKAEDVAAELGEKPNHLMDLNNHQLSVGLLFRYCAAINKLGPHDAEPLKPQDLMDKAFDRIVRGMPLADRPAWDPRRVVYAAPRFCDWMLRKGFTAPFLARELRHFRKGLPIGTETVRNWMNGKKSRNPKYMEALYEYAQGEITEDFFVEVPDDGRNVPKAWRQNSSRARR